MAVVKVIPISGGKVALVDEQDYESLSRFNWKARKDKNTYYAYRWFRTQNGKRKQIGMHRMVIAADFKVIDHIDGDGLNNCSGNLRIATNQENCFNSRKRSGKSKSRFKGVSWMGTMGKWRADITRDNQTRYLGCFANEMDAARAYDKAALVLFGGFAKTNDSMGAYG